MTGPAPGPPEQVVIERLHHFGPVVNARESQGLSVRACSVLLPFALCDTPGTPRRLGGGERERGTSKAISCSPRGPLIGKFGWPCLFVLVECSGLCFPGGFSTLLRHGGMGGGDLNDNMGQVSPYGRLALFALFPPLPG